MKHRNPVTIVTRLGAVCGLLLWLQSGWAASLGELPAGQEFIREMTTRHGFDQAELRALFAQAQQRPTVIEAMQRPAEAKPWYQYRQIFLKEARISDGAKFWASHGATLAQAEQRFGVAPEIIVAILGVESRFGRYKGNHPVLESVGTLAFRYPRRAEFFRSELEQFLLLAREEGWDPLAIQGSYAGAMGLPQFISSSYRRLAVDFDGDGHRDLLNSTADAIGSIANYLSRSGWHAGAAVVDPTRLNAPPYQPALWNRKPPEVSVATLGAQGTAIPPGLPPQTKAILLQMEEAEGYTYWLGYQNFYAITRYNHSPLYALAVYQLGEAIRLRYEAG